MRSSNSVIGALLHGHTKSDDTYNKWLERGLQPGDSYTISRVSKQGPINYRADYPGGDEIVLTKSQFGAVISTTTKRLDEPLPGQPNGLASYGDAMIALIADKEAGKPIFRDIFDANIF